MGIDKVIMEEILGMELWGENMFTTKFVIIGLGWLRRKMKPAGR